LRANNTGLDSIRIAAQTANQASACTRGQATTTPVACNNVEKTNRYRNLNITNLTGCRRIAQGKASCYGTPSDGFGYDRDKLISAVGIRFNPRDMTAACHPSLKGKIIVVRNTRTNQARAVTCTDTGAFQTKYGRVIDLAREAFNVFGPRCDKDGIMPSVELYQCPNT
jgi:rare lipoprotein A (peptidoglycan hydrolase)